MSNQRSILNYFSPKSNQPGPNQPGRNQPGANENSPGQRRGGGDAGLETTPKRSSVKKRSNKWITPVRGEVEEPVKKSKTTPSTSSASVVDVFSDDEEPKILPRTGPVASASASGSKMKVEDDEVKSLSPVISTPSASSSRLKHFRSATLMETPKSQSKKESDTPSSRYVSGPSNDDGPDSDGGTASWPPKDPEFSFLWPKNIKDKDGRRPDHPDYDDKTLFVPERFLQKRTEAQRQWWKIKAEMMDTVLCFKVGKFYELFSMDALVGIEHLNLLQMGKDAYHSGFPEVSFAKFADILRARGFKVTRVEQTESADARDKRLKNSSSKTSKVVHREVCQIISPGVSLLSGFDAESCNKHSNRPNYLLAVCQKPYDVENNRPEFGVCFVDCAIGKVFISQFDDDQQCSRLRTLVAHHPPAELLIEKYKKYSGLAVAILQNFLTCPVKQQLKSDSEFLSIANTFKYIREGRYFENEDGSTEYPKVLKNMLESRSSNPEVLPGCELALRSLGAIIWNLKRCLVDEDILTLKNFEQYVPTDLDTRVEPLKMKESIVKLPKSMILDAVTLDNLDILGKITKNKRVNQRKEDLYSLLNYASTVFGQRQLRAMIHSPSCDIEIINDRLDAIEDLENLLQNHPKKFEFLRKMPDLEKILCKLHSESITRKRDHPDSRAQMFMDTDVKKVKAFLDLLNCFEMIGKFMDNLSGHVSNFKSKLLKSFFLSESDGGNLPDLKAMISEFKKTFDVYEAKTNGKIIPERGTDPDYDCASGKIGAIKTKLENVRKRESKFFKEDVQFVESGKKRCMLKVSIEAFDSVNVPDTYTVETGNKKFKHLTTKELEQFVVQLREAEQEIDLVMTKIRRNLFARFCKHQPKLIAVVQCLALLDALLSLTKAKIYMQRYSTMSRPTIIPPKSSQTPFLSIKDGRNPILMQNVDDYIPNDIELSNKLIILTGPNMGGKSTLMRTAGLIAIMAQIGSYVPAAKVEMTPVDRIFTRLGAADNIVEGESTFMVELNQTCTIVKHGTINSLVLLDELGRGTATHDGTAIAYSVVDKLASEIKCRTLFATHYHSLVEEFQNNPSVVSNHMSCLVEKNEDNSESIRFLYKVQSGDCPKSYGFHAARLAGITDQVVKVAETVANEIECDYQITRKILPRSTYTMADLKQFSKLFKQLKLQII